MMLSASAARIGRVSSIITRREVLQQYPPLSRRSFLVSTESWTVPTTAHKKAPSSRKILLGDVSRRTLSTSTLHEKRHQSSVRVASLDDEQEDHYFPTSQSKVAPDSKPVPKTHFEDWMVNLGRGRDNEWLSGPRPKEWFTGLNPELCPGRLHVWI